MKRVVVSVTNDLVTDQRVFKVCKTLNKNGYDIFLIGRKLKESLPLTRPYKTKRIQLLFNKGPLFYAEYNIRLFFLLLFTKKDILVSNDLDTLLPNHLIGRLSNTPVVFDSHELFSETPAVQYRGVQNVWRFLEKILIPHQKYFITVSDSIANWFRMSYNNLPIVIRNLPNKSDQEIQNSDNYILYQGALNSGRGLLSLIESMLYLDGVILKIAGKGPFEKKVKEKTKTLGIESRIEFLGNLNPKDLKEITSKAILGLSLEEDLGLSYKYSLPNKLFDYIQCKIPVVGTYLPEIAKIISEYEIGEIISSHNPKDLATSIQKVLDNGRNSYLPALNKASEELIWENQEEQLLQLFNSINASQIQ